MNRALAGLALLALAGCPARAPKTPVAPLAPPPPDARGHAGAAGEGAEDWYPTDITLPDGVSYPCAVTALPADLVGVPADERRYVNHVYAVIIRVVGRKQVLLATLARGEDASADHEAYAATRDEARERLRAEPIPDGLEAFHADVLAALDLHATFFDQAVPRCAAGETVRQVHDIPEGRQASGKLLAAWGAMEARYGEDWSPALKDSVYHHLCALDLF